MEGYVSFVPAISPSAFFSCLSVLTAICRLMLACVYVPFASGACARVPRRLVLPPVLLRCSGVMSHNLHLRRLSAHAQYISPDYGPLTSVGAGNADVTFLPMHGSTKIVGYIVRMYASKPDVCPSAPSLTSSPCIVANAKL